MYFETAIFHRQRSEGPDREFNKCRVSELNKSLSRLFVLHYYEKQMQISINICCRNLTLINSVNILSRNTHST